MESNAPRSGEAGFSVIEGLIAAALLLIITVGILPLFSRSMLNNVKGNDSTRVSNGAIDEFERSSALPFNSGAMAVAEGSTETIEDRVLVLREMPSSEPGKPALSTSFRWEDPAGLGTGDSVSMTRERRLRQYSFDDFNPSNPAGSLDDPLDGDVEDRLVHLKVVDLEIRGFQETGSARPFRVRSIQAF